MRFGRRMFFPTGGGLFSQKLSVIHQIVAKRVSYLFYSYYQSLCHRLGQKW